MSESLKTKTLVIVSGTYSNNCPCAQLFDGRVEAIKYIEGFEDVDGFELVKSKGDHWKLVYEKDRRSYIDVEVRDTSEVVKYAVTSFGELPDDINKPGITDDFARFNTFAEAYDYALDFLAAHKIDAKPGENKKCEWILRDEKNNKSFLVLAIREKPDTDDEEYYQARDLVKLVKKYTKDYDAAYKEGKKKAIVNICIGVAGVIAALVIIFCALLFNNINLLNFFIYGFFVWFLPIAAFSQGYTAITKGYVEQELKEE